MLNNNYVEYSEIWKFTLFTKQTESGIVWHNFANFLLVSATSGTILSGFPESKPYDWQFENTLPIGQKHFTSWISS